MLNRIAAIVALGLAIAATPSFAQDSYPNKTITIIVGSPPGGPTDTFARLMAPGLEQKLGQTVIVENKPGASGTVAEQTVAQAPADGHTLWFTTTSHFVIPTVLNDPPPFDRNSYRPVVGLVYGAGVLLANPGTPYNTLQEFVDYAKAHPGEINFASAGVGSTAHITVEMIKDQLGIDLTHIPYNGNGPAMAALLAGEVQILGGDIGSAKGNLEDGSVKPLAVLALDRSAVIPDVPTGDETGILPKFNPVFYLGFVVKAETDDAIVGRLNEAVNELLATDEIKTAIANQQFSILGGTPEAFKDLYEGDAAATGAIIEKLNLQAQ